MAEEPKSPSTERDSSARRGTYVISAPSLPTKANDADVPSYRPADSQVFRDATNRRWRRFRVLFAIAAIAMFLVGLVFVRTMDLAATRGRLEDQSRFHADELARRAARSSGRPPAFVAGELLTPADASRNTGSERPLSKRFGWVEVGDESAFRSLQVRHPQLTDLVVAGLRMDETGNNVSGEIPRDVLEQARSWRLGVLELVERVRVHGRDDASRMRLAASLSARVAADHAEGVLLDLDTTEGDTIEADERHEDPFWVYDRLLRAMKGMLGDRTLAVLAYPGVAADELERLGKLADRVFVMARIDAADMLVPSSPAPKDWFDNAMASVTRRVAADKVVAILPTRAIAWPARVGDDFVGLRKADELEWIEAIDRCRIAGIRPIWDEVSGTPIVILPGTGGVASSSLVTADGDFASNAALVTWLPDGVTFARQLATLRALGVSAASWTLGGEDPRVWQVLDRPEGHALASALSVIPRLGEWRLVGRGVEVRVFSEEHDGIAHATLDAHGAPDREWYEALPADVATVQRAPVPEQMVVLTFDDGPDPEFTPQVLDILKHKGVPATFFVVGVRVESEPEIVQRLVAEGHEIGNHTFAHSDLSQVLPRRANLEIQATNLLLEATTGRTTVLFRPPYRAADVANDAADVASVVAAQRNGMSVVASTIDPRDWDNPSIEQIIDAVVTQSTVDQGGVVLLHDGGGDRSHTVAALEPIIDRLRARGQRFGTIRDVFGGRSRDEVNPPAAHFFTQTVCRFVWIGGTFGLRLVQWVALIALVLSLLRVASLAVFSILDLRRHGRKGDRLLHPQPPQAVSVVIPAYNEAKVIVRTVRSILASRGVEVEVIVLDDGSKDATADVVATNFERDPRVRVARLQNGGKAAALNVGFRLASHPLVVALDADTQFLPDTVVELVRHFEDDRVAAVAGRAVVGNPRGVLGRWQALEYVLGQAIERRAWHALGLVSVVPGAVGAWRRDAVLDAGGFGRDTLAEDCDLTIDLQVRGWRLAYAPQAIGLTEAPESVAALIKQRFRWSFGVLQTIWKHRHAATRSGAATRRVGLLLIPTVFISHFATPLFGPATTVAAAFAIYLGYWAAILPYAIATLVADAALTVFGLRLDRAPAKLAYDWIVFRTFYRWILFVALVRAAYAALRGGAVGWGKLVRKGTVRLQAHEVPH